MVKLILPNPAPPGQESQNVSKISAQLWSPRGKLGLSSPRAHRKTLSLVTSRREKKTLTLVTSRIAVWCARWPKSKFFSLCARWPKSKFFYEREVMKSDREVTKDRVFREVTKAVHLFSRHFWLSLPGGAQLGKMSFTIKFVYENYNF